MKKLHFFVLLLLPAFFWGACKKDNFCNDPSNTACPNFDICTTVFEANSGFVIIDSVSGFDLTVTADTFLSNSVYFRAVDTEHMDVYEWQVGTDARTFSGPVQRLDFSGFDGEVTFRLVTTVNDRYNCLASPAELTDTAYQTVYFRDVRSEEIRLWDEFKGRMLDEAGEEFTLNILGFVNTFNDSYRLFGLPLPGDCDFDEVGIPLGFGYDWLASSFRNFERGRCPRDLKAFGRLNPQNRDELRIDYSYNGDDGKRVERTFVGYRQ